MDDQILPGSTINLASPEDPHDSSDERLIEFNSNERSFTIRDYSRRVRGTDRYWSLPTQFLGNKVRLAIHITVTNKGELNLDKKWQSDDLFYIIMNEIRPHVDQF